MGAKGSVRIGTAGWSIPASHREHFPSDGSHLERYAETFDAVEINSSFYRHHQAKTYRRWGETVPPNFRFSVKLARVFTHERALEGPHDEMREVVEGISELGERLGVILVQLPPKLVYDPKIAHPFFREIRASTSAPIAFEPRHPTWSSPGAQSLLDEFDVARVRADPERSPAEKYGTNRFAYLRLHGTPEVYRSSYDTAFLEAVAAEIRRDREAAREVWCIFDNTTFGHSIANGVKLLSLLRKREEFPDRPGLGLASFRSGSAAPHARRS